MDCANILFVIVACCLVVKAVEGVAREKRVEKIKTDLILNASRKDCEREDYSKNFSARKLHPPFLIYIFDNSGNIPPRSSSQTHRRREREAVRALRRFLIFSSYSSA